MKIIIADDYDQMSREAADIVIEHLSQQPKCVLGLATGSTPIGLYANLVSANKENKISFADVTTFNLDEYRGLDYDDEQSYHYFMKEHLFNHVDIDQAQTHVPDGMNPNDIEACTEYEDAITAHGGIDLQLLGLGHDGHIGFNEPDDNFPVLTHLAELTEQTIEANSRLFDDINDVPHQAYTMGIGTIMKARQVLVVVSGTDKAETVRKAFFGPVVPEVPASALQMHPNVTVVLDEAAASLI